MSNETLNLILTAVVVPIAAALVPLLVTYINNLNKVAKEKASNEKLNKYIDIATDAISTSVVSTFQTYVDALKKADTFDEKAQQAAFAEARDKAIAIMGESAREALAAVYGDLDSWIDNKIELYVRKNKLIESSPEQTINESATQEN